MGRSAEAPIAVLRLKVRDLGCQHDEANPLEAVAQHAHACGDGHGCQTSEEDATSEMRGRPGQAKPPSHRRRVEAITRSASHRQAQIRREGGRIWPQLPGSSPLAGIPAGDA
jgi:hypothetical protein